MLDKVKEALELNRMAFISLRFGTKGKMKEDIQTFVDVTELALTELNTFIESNGWQDINKEPEYKAGHSIKVLTYSEETGINFGNFTPFYKTEDDKSMLWTIDGFSIGFQPTHWQPLPSIKSIKDMI